MGHFTESIEIGPYIVNLRCSSDNELEAYVYKYGDVEVSYHLFKIVEDE